MTTPGAVSGACAKCPGPCVEGRRSWESGLTVHLRVFEQGRLVVDKAPHLGLRGAAHTS
jgi:hypothetical protein